MHGLIARAHLVLMLALASLPAMAALPAVAPLSWSRPGADPYRGTVRQALASMHLPPEVVARLADRIERGQYDGQVSISDESVEADDGTPYARHFDMTTGHAIAAGSRSNLGPGRVERGALFRDGVYAVAVPDACANVTRLYPAGWPHFALPPVLAVPHVDLPGLPPGGHWPGASWPGIVPHGFVPGSSFVPPPVVAGPAWRPLPIPSGPLQPPAPFMPVPAPGTISLLVAGIVATFSRRFS